MPQNAPLGEEGVSGGDKVGVLSDQADDRMGGDLGRPRAGRPPLPVIPVQSREDMAVMLATHVRLLRRHARRRLGPAASEEAIDFVLEQTATRLLSREAPTSPHGLRLALKVVDRECREETKRAANDEHIRALRENPEDRFLGPLNGPLGRVLHLLSPRQQRTLKLAAHGLSTAEIARENHTSPEAESVALSRARAKAKALLERPLNGGPSASAFLLLASRRLRATLGSPGWVGAIEGATSPLVASAAMIPLVAFTLWGVSQSIDPGTSSMAAQDAQRHLRTDLAAGPIPGLALPVADTPTTVMSGRRPASSPPLTHQLAATVAIAAATEVPADIQLTAVATLPGTQSNVVVAIGTGLTCNCPVLTQSLDGGTTWESTGGIGAPPWNVTQLALPPTYPSDPRIFAGVDPVAGRTPYMASAFGQPFQALTGLPPGRIAVSAHLDDGDPRVFSGALTGLWSINPTGGAPYTAHEEIDYSGGYAIQAAIGAIATPTPTNGGPALLAWVRSFAVVPGSVGPPPLNPVLVKCPVASACTVASTLPLPPGALATAGPFVVAYTGDAAFVSHDLGASFAPLSLPTGARAVASFAFVGPAQTPWLSTSMSDGTTSVFRLKTSGAWADVSNGERVLHAHLGNLVAIDHGRVLDALVDAGYRCTTADVLRWLPRCP
jgi:DNA-directed RNA polymerase specialized sigma24 family protein